MSELELTRTRTRTRTRTLTLTLALTLTLTKASLSLALVGRQQQLVQKECPLWYAAQGSNPSLTQDLRLEP